jgi:hypothetical protein
MFSFLKKEYKEIPHVDQIIEELKRCNVADLIHRLKQHPEYKKSLVVAETCLTIAGEHSPEIYKLFSHYVRDNSHIIHLTLKNNGMALKDMSRIYKDNSDYVRTAISSNMLSYKFASKKVQAIPEVVNDFLGSVETMSMYSVLMTDHSELLSAFKCVPFDFYSNDLKRVTHLLEVYPLILSILPDSFKNDRFYAMKAIENDVNAYDFISDNLKKDIGLAKYALKNDIEAYKHLTEKVSNHKEIIHVFIEKLYLDKGISRETQMAIVQLINERKNHEDRLTFCLEAIAQSNNFILYVDDIKDPLFAENTFLYKDLIEKTLSKNSFLYSRFKMQFKDVENSKRMIPIVMKSDFYGFLKEDFLENIKLSDIPLEQIRDTDDYMIEQTNIEKLKYRQTSLDIVKGILTKDNQDYLFETYKNLVTDKADTSNVDLWDSNYINPERFKKFMESEPMFLLLNSMSNETLERVKEIEHKPNFYLIGRLVNDIYAKRKMSTVEKDVETIHSSKKNRKMKLGD